MRRPEIATASIVGPGPCRATLGSTSEPMIDQKALDRCFASYGYDRSTRHTYRASWSTNEVEHFIFIEQVRKSRSDLTARFGFRNPTAESFGLRSLRSHGGKLYRTLQHGEAPVCLMNFSFSRFGDGVTQWSLDTEFMDIAALQRALDALT